MSWAHAPVAGRRACRVAIIGRRARLRWARPRSAVTVSPTAPGLSPLTGFSRSGSPSSLGWLPLAGEAPLRSLDLARVLRLVVDNRWISGVPCVSTQVGRGPAYRPPDSVTWSGGLFMSVKLLTAAPDLSKLGVLR